MVSSSTLVAILPTYSVVALPGIANGASAAAASAAASGTPASGDGTYLLARACYVQRSHLHTP